MPCGEVANWSASMRNVSRCAGTSRPKRRVAFTHAAALLDAGLGLQRPQRRRRSRRGGSRGPAEDDARGVLAVGLPRLQGEVGQCDLAVGEPRVAAEAVGEFQVCGHRVVGAAQAGQRVSGQERGVGGHRGRRVLARRWRAGRRCPDRPGCSPASRAPPRGASRPRRRYRVAPGQGGRSRPVVRRRRCVPRGTAFAGDRRGGRRGGRGGRRRSSRLGRGGARRRCDRRRRASPAGRRLRVAAGGGERPDRPVRPTGVDRACRDGGDAGDDHGGGAASTRGRQRTVSTDAPCARRRPGRGGRRCDDVRHRRSGRDARRCRRRPDPAAGTAVVRRVRRPSSTAVLCRRAAASVTVGSIGQRDALGRCGRGASARTARRARSNRGACAADRRAGRPRSGSAARGPSRAPWR